MERLKHEANLFVPQFGSSIFVEAAEFDGIEPDLSGRRFVETRQQRQQRGFSSAGWADDGS